MRKQVLIGMMLLTLGAGLVGCGKSETNKTENNTTTAAGGSQVADVSTEAKKEETKMDTSDWTICDIDSKGSVKYPKEYYSMQDAGEIIYKTNAPDYAIIIRAAYNSKGEKLDASTYDNILDDATKSLGASYWMHGIFGETDTFKGVKVVTDTKKECKVNGYDAFTFTAKTTGAANNKERYIYGYLSCTSKQPFTVCGVALTDSDSESLKKEIQTEVDAIMNTFETK